MWEKIPGGVQNDRGAIVRYVSYRCYQYRDGERVMSLGSDSGRTPEGRQILELFVPPGWDAPHDSEKIEFSTRQAIKKDLEDALEAMNFVPEVADLYGENLQ